MRKLDFDWRTIDIEVLNSLAIRAGEAIMEVYRNEDFSDFVDFKSDNSPLTLADQVSHNILDAGLRAISSDIPVLSEEGASVPYEYRRQWKLFWLVDPLDGTKEFINRNGEFTVNIALIEEGVPVLGIIYAPVTNTLYFARQQEGAMKRQDNDVTRLSVNFRKSSLIAVGSRSHAAPEENEVLSSYSISKTIAIGSSLKFCLIAEGKADIYYRHGPTMEWDIAAGQAIVEAAGGKVLTTDRKPFRYNKDSLSNESFLCEGF